MDYRQEAAARGIPCNADATLVAADTTKDLIPARTNYTIHVQRVTYVPTTVAAQAITVKDNDGTPVPVALIPASQALPYVADFGPEGLPLTAGVKLFATPASAGPAGRFKVEGYYKLSTVQGLHASNQ
jgi:hypothetical protein